MVVPSHKANKGLVSGEGEREEKNKMKNGQTWVWMTLAKAILGLPVKGEWRLELKMSKEKNRSC